jgi:hydrogenase-1 operon protein HyaE
MTETAVWAPPRSAMSHNFNGLLDRLVLNHQLGDLNEAGFEAFVDVPGNCVVLLLDEPDKVPESWDLAVIFPDLLASGGTRPRAAIARPAHSGLLQARFGVKRMPAMLFLRDGQYVGVIEGLRDWNDFVGEVRQMLAAPVSRPPGIGIAVTAATQSGCH